MVVRVVDGERSKLGKKLARIMVASAVVAPTILTNPLIIDGNRSFAADSYPPIPTSMYVGQSIDLSRYGVSPSTYVGVSQNVGLYYRSYDSYNTELVAEHPGTYTIHLFEDDLPRRSVDIEVKRIDYDNNRVVDISDVVKHINSQSRIVGDPIGFDAEGIWNLFNRIDFTIPVSNNVPTIDDSSSSSVWINPDNMETSVFCLNDFFADVDAEAEGEDRDFLNYTIHSISSLGVDAWIENEQLMVNFEETPQNTAITVRASDQHGAFVDREFTFNVNSAPILNSSQSLSLNLTSGDHALNLNEYFTDPDEGQILSYSLSSVYLGCSNNIYVSANQLYIDLYNLQSSAAIDVHATDELGLSVTATFTVTQENSIIDY